MKIEIGSGRKPHKGYDTIDVESYANPTYLGDFRTMKFENLDEIRNHHLFEHFNRAEAIEVLKLWYSWLRPEGILIIETPDIEGISEMFLSHKNNRIRDWLIRHLYGSQEADWAYHRDGWYEDKFRGLLPKLGFTILEVRKSKSRQILPNITIVAKKNG
jgi:SAM-dependent methyltransferase